MVKLTYIAHHAGEWFNSDPEAVITQALRTGGGPNVSEAFTINGLPGPLYNCSTKGRHFFYFNKNEAIFKTSRPLGC